MAKKPLSSDRYWKRIYPKNRPARIEAEELRRTFQARCRHLPVPSGLWPQFFKSRRGKYLHQTLSTYLLERQADYCCYCQDRIFVKANANIEHILPRAVYPQFSFTYHNFAMACTTCNALKSDDDWYGLPTGEFNYSKHRKNFTVFHPNFHDYNQHIKLFCIQSNHIYVRAYFGKTDIGRKLYDAHLRKLTVYSVKSKANPSIAKAVDKLANYLANKGTSNAAAQGMLKTLSTLLLE